MQAFVTGGSGYLGRNLIRALVARGDHVRALARSEAAAMAVRALGAEPVRADLLDQVGLQVGMEGCAVVFHAAATVEEWGPRALFERINVEGTRSVLAAARAAGVAGFVHVGTEAVFADGGRMAGLDEHSAIPAKPLPRYPATKAAAERLVRAANAPGFATVVCRPRLIWGGDDTSVLPKMIEAVRKGQWAWVDGGRYRTNTCHVDNVVEGLLLAAERGRPGAAYFLSDGEPVEFRAFMSAQFATQGMDAGDKSLPRPLVKLLATLCEWAWEYLPLKGAPPLTRMAIALGTQEVTVSDALARRELGYVGRTSREAGLAAMKKARSV
ncbi:MAG: NAD-dependent epimerase/dehydratase family protein [Stagnimonas sp.]|nr:NAD-dependent epimerase/dehydratase family protein [Stagnimonas sp.]